MLHSVLNTVSSTLLDSYALKAIFLISSLCFHVQKTLFGRNRWRNGGRERTQECSWGSFIFTYTQFSNSSSFQKNLVLDFEEYTQVQEARVRVPALPRCCGASKELSVYFHFLFSPADTSPRTPFSLSPSSQMCFRLLSSAARKNRFFLFGWFLLMAVENCYRFYRCERRRGKSEWSHQTRSQSFTSVAMTGSPLVWERLRRIL